MRDDRLAAFEQARGRLFGLAYRMLGSVPEAEDVVQETWLRWQRTDDVDVREPVAFLTTTATRIAINAATSAYARRVSYPGPWLPEPIDTSVGPECSVLRAEQIELGLLLLLERLTPTQRAVWVLREAFGYSYADAAAVLATTESNARQLAVRGRAALRREAGGSRLPAVDRAEHRRLLTAFLAAARSGDMTALESMLTQDVVATSDGGGQVTAARHPIVGRERVARFLVGALAALGVDVESRLGEANGSPAVHLYLADRRVGVLWLQASAAGVEAVNTVLNPQKLFSARHEPTSSAVRSV